MVSRTLRYLAVVTLFVLFYPVRAHAAETGQSLLTACEDQQNSQQFGWCVGYIQGHSDALDGSVLATNKGECYRVSFAENTTVKQLVLVFVKYMHENPEMLNKSADYCVGKALISKGLMIMTEVKTVSAAREQ